MKARTLTLLAIFLLGSLGLLQAKVVDQATARKVAINLLYEKLNQKAAVAYTQVRVAETKAVLDDQKTPLYYVFSFEEGGFAIITADDALNPFLGYSTTGTYKDDPSMCNFRCWMESMVDQIQYYRHQKVTVAPEIQALWARYTDEAFQDKPLVKGSKNVDPMMISTWGQGKYYNTLCPADPQGTEGHCVVGCVATSMAQMMYFWRYPNQGSGSHGYMANSTYGNYGWQFADYGGTTYKWDEMVPSANEANLEMAQLSFHCGVAVNMNYGAEASGSFTDRVPAAMSSYFNYNSNIQYVNRMSYSTSQWVLLLKSDLDLKHPLIYSGRNSEGGHAWNCDGYEISGVNTLFHFNWGWDGYSDGFFNVDDLTPGGDPPYNQDNAAVRYISPSATGFPYYCTGQKVLTGTKGSVEDGSSFVMNYQDNADCSWLIAPTDSVTKIYLTFNKLDTEDSLDVIKVYAGADTTATLLLETSGNTLPSGQITSNTNRMLITFKSNGSNTAEGFFATYKCNYAKFCQGTTLSTPSGSVSDGSGPLNYNNNTTCSWTIAPATGTNMNLWFTYFDVEPTEDYVKVYDLASQTLLGTYSGNSLPSVITAPSGQMYIEFKSNYIYTYGGWEALYSLGNAGFDETQGIHDLNIYPNPANSQLQVHFTVDTPRDIRVQLMNITGQTVQEFQLNSFMGPYSNTMDVSQLSKGIYMLKLTHELGTYTHKVVVQ